MSGHINVLENENTTKIFGKFSRVFKVIIMGLMVFIYGYLSVSSILQTTFLETVMPSNELSTYHYDDYLLNVVLLLFMIIIIDILYNRLLEKINPKVFTVILCVYTLVLSTIWVFSVRSNSMHDSYMCTSTATMCLEGDYSNLQPEESYFYYYPYQLGYVFVCQIVNVFFKDDKYFLALQMLNVFSLVAIFLALIKLAHDIFKSRKVVNLTIFMCFGFIASILFTTFIYGTLLGFAFASWAIVLTVRYTQTEKKYLMVVSAVLLGIAIMVKPNNMIVLLAICIILAIKFLDTKKLYDIVSIVLCGVIGLNLLNVVISSYERKADVDLGSGIPKILWMNMGLHEAVMGCGWYNASYTASVYDNNNRDDKLATQEGIEQIKEQLDVFLDDQTYTARFFSEKVLSQWNEPTFDSIWISKTRGHTKDVPQFVTDVYEGDLGEYVEFFMNQYQQLLYVGAFIGLIVLYKKKKVYYYAVPLVILGGFMYHLLFEAKAQYVLTYAILLVPICAYGLEYIVKIDVLSKFKHLVLKGATDN